MDLTQKALLLRHDLTSQFMQYALSLWQGCREKDYWITENDFIKKRCQLTQSLKYFHDQIRSRINTLDLLILSIYDSTKM